MQSKAELGSKQNIMLGDVIRSHMSHKPQITIGDLRNENIGAERSVANFGIV